MHDSQFSGPVEFFTLIDPGPYMQYIDAYRRHLLHLGHSCWTVEEKVLSARHFCHWLHLSGKPMSVVSDADVELFADHDCRCRGAHHRRPISAKSLSRAWDFVRFLAEAGIIQASPGSMPARAPAPEIAAWLDWLRQHKGLSLSSLRNYEYDLGKLLPLIGTDPSCYDATNLRSAFLTGCSREGRGAWPRMATALRSWLGYNATLGRCPAELTAALPRMVRPRRDHVPRGIKASDVERLLAACDTATALGRRDLAILLLVARLGLRASEVHCLTFDQIDWQRGCLRITGKGRRETELPLPQEVGDAILAWLENGRPPLDDPHVFLCLCAPWRPLGGRYVVSQTVARALRNAGLSDTPSRGANLLRHSLAENLVEDGATLHSVATLMRHRRMKTTSIYAKADPGRLGEIAQPWPGGAS